MGSRLTKAPVCYTLAQMRFNPVLEMNSILASLQDAFRELGFPDYAATTVKTLDVSRTHDSVDLRNQEVRRLVFKNRRQSASLSLGPSALTYELTDYPVFADFLAMFLKALDIVDHHRKIEYSDRLGIRMLDAIQPQKHETLHSYISPQAIGLDALIDSALNHQQTYTESCFTNGTNVLVVKTMRVHHGIVMPPDLTPLRLKFSERFTEHEGETLMLDCDSFREERADFSSEMTKAELTELKSALSSSFKALVTPHALKIWE